MVPFNRETLLQRELADETAKTAFTESDIAQALPTFTIVAELTSGEGNDIPIFDVKDQGDVV